MDTPAYPPTKITRASGFKRGKTETFTAGEITLGTESTCDMRFDPTWDKTVSARHAVLRWNGSELWLEDQSRDGTWIDGQRVTRRAVTNGTVMDLGKGGPKLKIEFELPAAASPSRGHGSGAGVAGGYGGAAVATQMEVAGPAAGVITPRSAPESRRENWRSIPVWAWAIGAVVIVGLAIFFLLPLLQRANADEKLAEYSRVYEGAVGLVVLVGETQSGPRSIPMATAWAIGPHTFATNSHVSEPVQAALKQGATAFVILNRRPDQRFRVKSATVHPKYNASNLNHEGRSAAIPPYDVGLLEVDGTAPTVFKIARRKTLEHLDSGDRVAFIGFPMEGLAGGGVDFRNPVANMQSGIVTSVTDYWLSKAKPEERLLVQHNLGATGGASGSPVFNARGEVVAILSAGNIIGQVNLSTGETTRAPSGVMINFAQRVDVLRDIHSAYPKD